MVGGAVLNAAAFIGGNYLARALGGGEKAALEEKERHDKALEAYQAAYAKYTRDRTKLLDWIATNAQIKAHAKQNFTNTDYASKLYNKAHPDERMIPLKSPSSQISINQVSSRKMVNFCSWTLGLLLWAMQPFVLFEHWSSFLIRYGYWAQKDSLQPRLLLENRGRFRILCQTHKTRVLPENFGRYQKITLRYRKQSDIR